MNSQENISVRRRNLCSAALSVFLLSACEAKSMRVFLNVSLFSYLNRPIFDVEMNGTNFMSALAHGFYGASGVMLMQPLTLGPQRVTWKLGGPEGMPRNGELVAARNMPVLGEVPTEVKWLALHVYPDDTAEIKLSRGTADELQTARGQAIIEAWESKPGADQVRAACDAGCGRPD
jgi:hypothetical protein